VTFDGPPLSHLSGDVIDTLTSKTNGIYQIIAGKVCTCCLGILGAQDHMLNTDSLPAEYPNFKVVMEKDRQSVRVILENAPSNAFVDGKLTRLRRGHLAAVIRDMALQSLHFKKVNDAKARSTLVEKMIDDAGLLTPTKAIVDDKLLSLGQVLCQGGHTIGHHDYNFCKRTGEELGLRYFEGITGGGPGTMRGALKGNRKGLEQQKIFNGRQIGFTAPDIIAAEPPNVYVTDLVILPDIEKRLEAFTRKMHAVILFPGGAGTAEELLLILAIKMHQRNANQHIPIALAAPKDSLSYLDTLTNFVKQALGPDVQDLYDVQVGSPEGTAKWIQNHMHHVLNARDKNDDSHEWNRSLYFPEELQVPFETTHENVAALHLHTNQELYKLCAELRKLFKAIVFGSVTTEGREYITKYGKYQVSGEPHIIDAIDTLLKRFIDEKRMRTTSYEPCYDLVRKI